MACCIVSDVVVLCVILYMDARSVRWLARLIWVINDYRCTILVLEDFPHGFPGSSSSDNMSLLCDMGCLPRFIYLYRRTKGDLASQFMLLGFHLFQMCKAKCRHLCTPVCSPRSPALFISIFSVHFPLSRVSCLFRRAFNLFSSMSSSWTLSTYPFLHNRRFHLGWELLSPGITIGETTTG